ncbi:hypothetical protein [Gordonia aquimaris]|uniref:Mce-associated membrane protein n=1 Tax=Gordonia aquimaris TaxID=2984863 RepID=A0A9X3DBG7_9ACTN|nr:hypothetical protein [Gordonia aquimaris]MCX2967177.1 hypothetical protein [Gordonia aquimaris]
MATNPRPPRKGQRPKRKSTPRVAGRTAPGHPADGTPNVADATPNVADATPNVADATSSPADETQNPADGPSSPTEASTTSDVPENDPDPAEVASAASDGTADSVDDSPSTDSTDDADQPKPAAKRRVARVSTLRPGDGAATSPSQAASSTPSRRRPVRSGLRTVVGVLAALAVVLGIFALVAGLYPGADIGPNQAFVDQPATTELTSQVQSKACALTVNTVDIDKWAGEARAVLTGQALTEFDEYLPQQRDILNQTKAVADCRVESVGVADLSGGDDGDTAQVVVNMIVSQQQAGIAGQSAAPRYQFGMIKQGDAWLINKVDAF